MPNDDWIEANRRYLLAALGCVRNAVRRAVDKCNPAAARGRRRCPRPRTTSRALQEAADALPAPSALETLVAAFGLSPFERGVLLLCAGVELDSRFAADCLGGGGVMGRRFRPSVRPWPPCLEPTGRPGADSAVAAGGG